jgi:hypothetical protein
MSPVLRNSSDTDIRVSIGKQELLDALTANREQHRRIFEEACEGYRAKAVEILEQNIANIKARKLERIHVSLPVPEDHTKDYDRVIRMVEMHRGETLELDQEHFAQYVMDDWGWRTSLLDTAVFYGSATAKKAGAAE